MAGRSEARVLRLPLLPALSGPFPQLEGHAGADAERQPGTAQLEQRRLIVDEPGHPARREPAPASATTYPARPTATHARAPRPAGRPRRRRAWRRARPRRAASRRGAASPTLNGGPGAERPSARVDAERARPPSRRGHAWSPSRRGVEVALLRDDVERETQAAPERALRAHAAPAEPEPGTSPRGARPRLREERATEVAGAGRWARATRAATSTGGAGSARTASARRLGARERPLLRDGEDEQAQARGLGRRREIESRRATSDRARDRAARWRRARRRRRRWTSTSPAPRGRTVPSSMTKSSRRRASSISGQRSTTR